MPPRGADGRAADDGVDRVGQPGQRAADDRPVVHDQRRLRRRRLQPAAGGDADRVGPCRGGHRRRLRGVRSALPRRLRFDARLQRRRQRASRARVAPVCRRSRRLHLLGGRRHRGARDARGRRGARRDDSRQHARLGDVERRRRRHGGAVVGRRAALDRDGAAARRPDARPTSTTSTRTARPRRPATWPRCAPSAPCSAIATWPIRRPRAIRATPCRRRARSRRSSRC